ncbi:hypothetical protein QC764_0024790 [Podospora pseudoanserina]|uniref:Uncharacterized protein n=1 Tax=Podospora pseudoanserina TaxID=2609844 RepID=A0ABR0ISY7_9PEZI|nr:hypothetical protein QC764_0024790 [Podospora pseudoanserina]
MAFTVIPLDVHSLAKLLLPSKQHKPARDGRGLKRQHVSTNIPTEGKDAVEVDLNDFVKVLIWELLAGVPPLDAGAIDQYAYFPALV